MRADLLLLASNLARRGEAFALATVVRRERPSSAQVGDTALITPGGAFYGWLGGSCTQPVVVREAVRALADGTPRLLSFSPDPESDRRAGVVVFPMTCHSGGTVDIYIEPLLPSPRLVVFGVSPVAQALARLGKVMGYAVDAVDPGADRATFPEADEVFTALDAPQLRLRAAGRGAQRFAVVATMGQRDEEAVLAARALQPAYLGVVASRRRFEQIRDTLVAQGAGEDVLTRIKSPAGLDIGAQTAEEIAVSVLAEIVQVRRAAEPGQAAPTAEAAVTDQERDPVCGMIVEAATATHHAEAGGHTYYFCCSGCRERFLREPERYALAYGGGGAA